MNTCAPRSCRLYCQATARRCEYGSVASMAATSSTTRPAQIWSWLMYCLQQAPNTVGAIVKLHHEPLAPHWVARLSRLVKHWLQS